MHQQREEVNGRELNFVFKYIKGELEANSALQMKYLTKNTKTTAETSPLPKKVDQKSKKDSLRSSNRLVRRWARADKRYILSLWRQFF